jgi:hypothetical protein
MGHETSKAHARRLHEGYFERVLIGAGIEIDRCDDPMTSERGQRRPARQRTNGRGHARAAR